MQVAGGVGELVSFGMFEDEKPACEMGQRRLVEVRALVWWIDKRDVEGHFDDLERLDEIHLEDLVAVFNSQRFQVLSNDLTRLPGLLDEVDEGSAAADGFDANGAHPRAAVKECCALDTG